MGALGGARRERRPHFSLLPRGDAPRRAPPLFPPAGLAVDRRYSPCRREARRGGGDRGYRRVCGGLRHIWKRGDHFVGRRCEDAARYFYRHPGPRGEFARWCLEMEFNWLGIDAIFPSDDWQIMHRALFPRGMIHVENIGGDIGKVLNRRCMIGCFPLRIEAESAPCRVAAFIDAVK